MDFLKQEIERKKADLIKSKLVTEKRKYFKRSDLEEQQRREYLQALQSKSSAGASSASAAADAAEDVAGDDFPDYSPQDVVRRLRQRGEPIKLFGETFQDTCRRLRELEVTAPEVRDGGQQRNELRDAIKNVEEQDMNELLLGEAKESKKPFEKILKYSFKDFIEMTKDVDKEDLERQCTVIRRFFKYLLDLWEIDLDARPDEVKQTREGKFATATFVQTTSNMKPLFKSLRRKDLDPDIVKGVTEIMQEMVKREYVRANDAYLRMAIGNAAWPIGVTNVGIHSRTGREKIFSQKIAHVLNDETKRKYIQGIKRLMTFCQKRFTTDPSKCVDFKGMNLSLYPVNEA